MTSHRNTHPKVTAWVFLAVWMSLIMSLSSVPGSSIPSAGESPIGKVIDYVLRQGGHLLLHVVLGLLAWRATRRTWGQRTALVVALLLVLPFAVLDELYQAFTPGRDVNAEDLAYNTVGVLIPFALMWGKALLPFQVRARWSALMLLTKE